jgi:hypothetical protein
MIRLTATLAALALTLAAGSATAQPRNCAERPRVLERLAEVYGETRQSIGLGANNAVVEVFASTETGTWSITVTMPSGLTCLIASGQAFERLDEPLAPASQDDA